MYWKWEGAGFRDNCKATGDWFYPWILVFSLPGTDSERITFTLEIQFLRGFRWYTAFIAFILITQNIMWLKIVIINHSFSFSNIKLTWLVKLLLSPSIYVIKMYYPPVHIRDSWPYCTQPCARFDLVLVIFRNSRHLVEVRERFELNKSAMTWGTRCLFSRTTQFWSI